LPKIKDEEEMDAVLLQRVLNRFRELGPEEQSRDLDGVLDLFEGASLSGSGDVYTLFVGSSFVQRMVGERYLSEIVQVMKEVLDNDRVVLTVDVLSPVKTSPKKRKTRETPPEAKPKVSSGVLAMSPEQSAAWETHLSPRYTFSNYVVGMCNQFAHAAATAIANNPSNTYNPFYVFGGVGLGKTHLVSAIGNQMKSRFPSLKILYITTESFLNEMVTALKFSKMNEFRERYRKIDVLIVDDIQFLSGKERTQEEFFYTFNALFENGKQIILSSDCMPSEIATLEDRLKSRFSWGLIADIQIPDFETKIAILRDKMTQEGLSLPEEVVFFLANTVKTNIRELEGAMIRLGAWGNLMGRPITIEVARKLLSDILPTTKDLADVERILAEVAGFYGVTAKDIRSRKRTRSMVVARHMAAYLIRDIGHKSYPEIGRELGGRDHSTIIHSCKNIEDALESDPQTMNEIEQIKKRLENRS
jgi:chromosomal replication initiator protein